MDELLNEMIDGSNFSNVYTFDDIYLALKDILDCLRYIQGILLLILSIGFAIFILCVLYRVLVRFIY